MAHLIECSAPYGFDFLPEFLRDGFGLLLERPPRSFDFAFELGPHCASPSSIRNVRINETINRVFWTVRLQSNGNCRRRCPDPPSAATGTLSGTNAGNPAPLCALPRCPSYPLPVLVGGVR